MTEKIKYPRVIVSFSTHRKVKKLAKELGNDMMDIGNRIVLLGIEEYKKLRGR